MPRHIEQPAPRHSAPASLKTTSRPSRSACSRTRTDPGTTSIRVDSATVATVHDLGGGAQVLDAAVGARADKDRVDIDVTHPRAGLQAHVGQRLLGRVVRSPLSAKSVGDGTLAPERGALARVGPPRDERPSSWTRRARFRRRDRASSSVTRLRQYSTAVSHSAPCRRMWAALQVVERGLVRCDHAGLGTPLDRHVAHRHAALPSRAPGWPRRGTPRRTPARRRCRRSRSA